MTLFELALKATLIFAAAGASTRMLARQSAAIRHLVWTTAVVAVLMLPLASLYVPAVPLPALTPMPTVLTIYANQDARETPPVDWMAWATRAWLFGFVLCAIRVGIGLVRISLVTHSAERTSLGADGIQRFQLRRRVTVRVSDRITIPTTWGAVWPEILLPSDAERWTRERLDVALAHELGHIRRFDWFTQLLAQVACTIYWFHPLAWFAERQLRHERELACDDGVLTHGIRGSQYAEHLVEIARNLGTQSDQFTVGVAMAQRSSLEARVLAMLNPTLRRERVTRKLFAVATLALACVLAPLAALRAPAQGSGGKVSGTVYDPSGGVVAKARVMLRNLEGRNTELTNTSSAGAYEFAAVPAGRYRLEVAAPGFKKYQQESVVIGGGAVAVQNVVLDIGQISESIDVVGNSSSAKPTALAPGRLKMGGQVQATKLTHMVRPEYPLSMKQQGIEGTVLMRAVISREGQVLKLEVLNTDVHPDLVTAAKDAVSQWRYQPTLLNGEPVEIVTEITVNFTLAP